MESVMSPEAYREHVRLYEGYRDRLAANPGNPDHLDHDAVVLHQVYFDCVAEPTPPSPNSFFLLALKSSMDMDIDGLVGMIRDLSHDPRLGWIVLSHCLIDGNLRIHAMRTHDCGAVMTVPVLALDLYEHAWWMDWGTDRERYVEQFLAFVNWRAVERRYDVARSLRP